MSTIASSLSAGLQALSNTGLLPSGLSSQQLQKASPAQLTAIAVSSLESSAISSLFSDAVSSSDSVSLSQDLTSTLLGATTPSGNSISNTLLQAVESRLSNGSSNSSSAPANLDSNASTQIGSLFSYLA